MANRGPRSQIFSREPRAVRDGHWRGGRSQTEERWRWHDPKARTRSSRCHTTAPGSRVSYRRGSAARGERDGLFRADHHALTAADTPFLAHRGGLLDGERLHGARPLAHAAGGAALAVHGGHETRRRRPSLRRRLLIGRRQPRLVRLAEDQWLRRPSLRRRLLLTAAAAAPTASPSVSTSAASAATAAAVLASSASPLPVPGSFELVHRQSAFFPASSSSIRLRNASSELSMLSAWRLRISASCSTPTIGSTGVA